MAFCHNSISLSATAPVLPVELQMIFTIDTFTDLPHYISISIVHGIFTIRMKKVGRHQNSGKLLVLLQTVWIYSENICLVGKFCWCCRVLYRPIVKISAQPVKSFGVALSRIDLLWKSMAFIGFVYIKLKWTGYDIILS